MLLTSLIRTRSTCITTTTTPFIRSYGLKSSAKTRINHKGEKNDCLTSFDDLQEMKSYWESVELVNNSTNKKIVNEFKFTGKNLVHLMNDSLTDSITLKKSSEKLNSSGTLSRDEAELLNKINYYLTISNEKNLFNLLKTNKSLELLPKILEDLSPFQVSLLIKKLTNNHYQVGKSFIVEQKFSSRLLKNKPQFNKILSFKVTVYRSTKKILETIIISKDESLNILDYENLIKFHVNNLSYLNAIKLIEQIESKNLKMTNLIWSYKFQILTNSSVHNWSIGRYNLFKNNSQSLSKHFHYKHHPTSIHELLKLYLNSNLLPDLSIYSSIILSIGRSKDVDLLNNFITETWLNASLPRQSLIKPDFKLLNSIILAYAYNSELTKGIKLTNSLILKYNMNLNNSQSYWETVLRCTGLTTKNTLRDIQTSIYMKSENGHSSNNNNFKIQHEIIDLIWNKSMSLINYPSNEMIKLKLNYSSLDSIIKEIPNIYNLLINLSFNEVSNNSIKSKMLNNLNLLIINENLFFSYLNNCSVKLQLIKNFYKAELIINRFSINNQMKSHLLSKLKINQDKFVNHELQQKKKLIHDKFDDDDDDDSLW